MKFFLVFELMPSKPEAVYAKFLTVVCSATRNNNDNNTDGFLIDYKSAVINGRQNVSPLTDINARQNVSPLTDICCCFKSFMELLEAYPKCWVTRALHD